jgi:hypothetical protein
VFAVGTFDNLLALAFTFCAATDI